VTHRFAKTYAPLTTITVEELPMANQDIDIIQELLNKLDGEITDLSRSILDAQGAILMLKFLSQRLRENQEAFTRH